MPPSSFQQAPYLCCPHRPLRKSSLMQIQSYALLEDVLHQEVLHFSLWDHDFASKDDPLGNASLQVPDSESKARNSFNRMRQRESEREGRRRRRRSRRGRRRESNFTKVLQNNAGARLEREGHPQARRKKERRKEGKKERENETYYIYN